MPPHSTEVDLVEDYLDNALVLPYDGHCAQKRSIYLRVTKVMSFKVPQYLSLLSIPGSIFRT